MPGRTAEGIDELLIFLDKLGRVNGKSGGLASSSCYRGTSHPKSLDMTRRKI